MVQGLLMQELPTPKYSSVQVLPGGAAAGSLAPRA